MTRSNKALNPRALAHDRSISKNGRDQSQKRDGYGGWGNISARHHHITHDDCVVGTFEEEDEAFDSQTPQPQPPKHVPTEDQKVDKSWLKILDLTLEWVAADIREGEFKKDLNVRKNFVKRANKGKIDLSSIARTSYVVAHQSPPSSELSTSPSTSLSSSFESNASTGLHSAF
ncbi:hypothetical protein [Phaffia rhodozyma]|uniref:Uncharacterized protein n=1 Tax=Phaffia rhodozyma TaxID=264483 RepID=A0A0F7SP62_PHARH|nr:hypothetical protein [Phaffia rhodozyma]